MQVRFAYKKLIQLSEHFVSSAFLLVQRRGEVKIVERGEAVLPKPCLDTGQLEPHSTSVYLNIPQPPGYIQPQTK